MLLWTSRLFTVLVLMLLLNGYSLLISVVKVLFTNTTVVQACILFLYQLQFNVNTGSNNIKREKFIKRVKVSRLVNLYSIDGLVSQYMCSHLPRMSKYDIFYHTGQSDPFYGGTSCKNYLRDINYSYKILRCKSPMWPPVSDG